MEDFLPFVFFIIYAIFQVFSSLNKSNKKKTTPQQQPSQRPQPKVVRTEPTRPQPKPKAQEPAGDFFKEFMKQLEELENPQPVSQPESVPQPVVVSMEEIPGPAVSSEITVAEYSNLEENIIDQTHRSKFEHHSSEAFKEKKKIRKPITLFKNVDTREAFIYSLIFDRKEY